MIVSHTYNMLLYFMYIPGHAKAACGLRRPGTRMPRRDPTVPDDAEGVTQPIQMEPHHLEAGTCPSS